MLELLSSLPLLWLLFPVVMTAHDESLVLEAENPKYFIFGRFNGECGGDHCVEIFKIENDSLFSITLTTRPGI